MKEIINITSNGIKQAIDDLVDENERLQDKIYKLEEQLQQKENIIKEVREYIEELLREEFEITDTDSVDYGTKCQRAYFSDSELIKVLEILDKENKE